MIQMIYIPKQSCPRDLGIFFCEDCQSKNLDLRTSFDEGYREPMRSFCKNKDYNGKVCGVTHLGYTVCDDCQKAGRQSATHFGEYDRVAHMLEPEDLIDEHD